MTTPGPIITAPIVSTQWLADYLGSPGLVVLDATVLFSTEPRPSYVSGHEQYLVNGHIAGALFADVIAEFSDPDGPYPFTRPSAEQFAAAAGALGIDNDSTVVVYDSQVGQWAARIWWLFRAFGYDRVAVLNGGLTKWNLEERETDVGHVEPVATVFDAVERPDLWVDKQFIERVVAGDELAALVCAVPPKEFTGEQPTRARAGHIPGSFSVPAGLLVERESRALVSTEALTARFAPALAADRVVAYCNGGIAAASDALALTLLGHRNVAIYDGSLNEWAADAESVLATV
jgi:thiosulfate/3-mercaptopyruvate sulfurtransferase